MGEAKRLQLDCRGELLELLDPWRAVGPERPIQDYVQMNVYRWGEAAMPNPGGVNRVLAGGSGGCGGGAGGRG